MFAESSIELQKRTLKFHSDFYNATGTYKNEIAYKLCKCTNLPTKTNRSNIYTHSIEAGHYPLIACERCGILMEKEDTFEHDAAKCDPLREGEIFLEAMKRQAALNAAKKQQEKVQNQPERIDDFKPTSIANEIVMNLNQVKYY